MFANSVLLHKRLKCFFTEETQILHIRNGLKMPRIRLSILAKYFKTPKYNYFLQAQRFLSFSVLMLIIFTDFLIKCIPIQHTHIHICKYICIIIFLEVLNPYKINLLSAKQTQKNRPSLASKIPSASLVLGLDRWHDHA